MMEPNARRTAPQAPAVRVALAGFGAIGRAVFSRIGESIPEYQVTAVAAKDRTRARQYLAEHGSSAAVVGLAELSRTAEIVIECAPAALFADIAEPVIAAGKRLIVLSVGALLDHWGLVEQAKRSGAQILVPSGALLALDAVQAAAEGEITSVRMTSRKPPQALAGAPFIEARGINLAEIDRPIRLFTGSVREAIAGFPANLNVAVALSLAGIGPDRTTLEVWVDPRVTRNTHHIEVESDSARLTFSIENIPSENPKTGRITALSVAALLRKLVRPLRIGT